MMIYLDHSATAPPLNEVLDTYVKVSQRFFANPSSLHRLGSEAEQMLRQSRQLVAELMNVKAAEIIFTSGGSESNNLAIKGTAEHYQTRGKHIITTCVEHPSVYNTCKQLEGQGFDVTYLPVDHEGRVTLSDLIQSMRSDTILVSIIHVNNETGTIQPISDIANYLKDFPKVLFHVDHVQGIGKVPLNISDEGIDFCSLSGHKFHGPRGTGLLYCRSGIQLAPLINGGGQEEGRRSGTENIAGIAGMVKALRLIKEKEASKIGELKQHFAALRFFCDSIPIIDIHTPETGEAPHILNMTVHNIKSEVLIHALEEKEIYISTKSACSSKEQVASRVLLSMGISEKDALESVRISLSYNTTEEEINIFCEAFEKTIAQLMKDAG